MNDSVNKREIEKKITPVIEKVAGQMGLIPIEISFVKESGKWHLRIFIFSYEHAISHQDCEDLTRSLSDYLDQMISVPYYMEVSSPGIERKLKSSKEYTIFKGQKVIVKLKQPIEGDLKLFEAVIVDYNPESGLQLKVSDGDKIVNVEENNVSSIKLKPEYNL